MTTFFSGETNCKIITLAPDPNWWQARLAEDPCLDTAKLVPSRELEEKRKAFVPPEADYTTKIGLCGSLVSRKKKKELFKSKQVKILASLQKLKEFSLDCF
jgi:hypothetical protein